MGEGKVAAVAPTSAMICCAESTPKARDFGAALHCVMVCRKQVGHLLIELSEVILDHAQLFQRELQQPTVDRMQCRTRLESIAQLRRRGTQARGRELREGGGIRLTLCQRLQHAAGADAQQVRDDARHLDVRLFEQRL